MFLTPATASAKKLTGLQNVDGAWYYYDKKGVPVKKQLKKIKKRIYYFKKNGKAATGWCRISGKTYYFDKKARAYRGLKEIGGATYYFSREGVMQSGWQKVGKRWAYFKKNGKIKKKGSVDGIKIKKTGYAAPTSGQKKMLQCQDQVKKIANSITSSSMSRSQKLRACWNYMTSSRFHYVRRYDFSTYGGWVYDYGMDILTSRGGNCYRFACAFALLAKEIGYRPAVVWGMVPHVGGGLTPHCLVKIDGLFYDPEGQFAGWAQGIYGLSYYPMTFVQQGTVTL